MEFNFKKWLKKLVCSRYSILIVLYILASFLLIKTLFKIQIIDGSYYQESFLLRIEKNKSILAPRGNIYDRNGVLLAGNELSYNVTVEDTYNDNRYKNLQLNSTLYEVVKIIEKNKDKIVNDFPIEIVKGNYQYKIDGVRLTRFKADIFGYADPDDMSKEQKEASADDMMKYLSSTNKYGLFACEFNMKDFSLSGNYNYSDEIKKNADVTYPNKLSKKDVLNLVTIRYLMSANYFQRYKSVDVATNVSEATQTAILENKNHLQGVDVANNYRRFYNESALFSNIIGYTGRPSIDEISQLSKKDDSYAVSDFIGKSGIEKSMEDVLRGKKGEEKIFVNNLGKLISTSDKRDPVAGNNIYLSIDSKLQKACYDIIERKLADILYSKIENIKYYNPLSSTAENIKIPITDVYFALINNNILDISEFNSKKAPVTARKIYDKFNIERNKLYKELDNQLRDSHGENINKLNSSLKEAIVYIVEDLEKKEYIKKIDGYDDTFDKFNKGDISIRMFLDYCVSKGLLNINKMIEGQEYLQSNEIYSNLLSFLKDELRDDKGFSKIIYKKLIYNSEISGKDLCLLLYDYKIIKKDEKNYEKLKNNYLSPYNFIKSRVRKLDLTPAMLGLDPCNGSVVVQDSKTGEILAMVSYPGYDSNKLANNVDPKYYENLINDKSESLYNHATQEITAPGSTYKMISAITGLENNVVNYDTRFYCRGIFKEITPHARCWKLSGHGSLNVVNAIRESCDVYFYNLAYNMSKVNGRGYDSVVGTDKLKKYAKMFGLGDKTGIEIPEAIGHISNEDAVRSAIGQGNNAFTTIELSRYVNTISNNGDCYNLTLLSKITDSSGRTIKSLSPTLKNKINVSKNSFNIVQKGMREVVTSHSVFHKLEKHVSSAGKTGTAEYLKTRGNHVLYVGYAPYDKPEISMAVRIPFGYKSTYASEVSRDIMAYYFKINSLKAILNGAMR